MTQARDGVAFDEAEIGPLIDRLAGRFAEPPWDLEIERARQEHDDQLGRIFDDDELYAQQMASFLEWYVLERPLPGEGTPAVHALASDGVAAADRGLLAALARSYRSLFEVLSVHPGGLLLNDLILGGRWLAGWTRAAGVARGEVFEARLLPWRGEVRLGPVVLFHPQVARRQIHRLLEVWEAEGRLGPHSVWKLAGMRLRFARFRKVAVDHVYRIKD